MHLSTLTTTLLALAATATANGPSQSPPSSNQQTFLINYNFETYPTTSLGQAPVVATIINDYDLLHFSTILVNTTQPTLAGVPCHTPPVCSAFTLSQTLLAGLLTPGQNAAGLGGPGIITAAYQYSPITYFNPYVFYYGCLVADSNGAASVPVSCNITATGIDSKGKTIYTQVFPYKVTAGTTLQQMTLGYFEQGWKGLQVQTLQLSVTNNATTAAIFDNFLASVFGPQDAAVKVDF